MSELDIGEVMRRSGLPASTLRFYEEKGLISSIDRRMLTAKAEELDQTIGELALMRDALRPG